MVYLDYSATTPLDSRVKDVWCEAEEKFFANANSSHALGLKAKAFNDENIKKIAQNLHILPEEFILTSSAVEANNFAIKGMALKYPDKKHIITSEYEHASVVAAIAALDLEIDFIELDENGLYDLESLKSLIRKDTLMVSLVAVDSETGIRQNVEEIANFCKSQNIIFHCDATQALGKCHIDLKDMDLVSISAHKIYGPKGVGALIKKKNIKLVPLLHGGHSLTPFRSSTPATALLAAFSKAIELAYLDLDKRIEKVETLNQYLRNKLMDCEGVHINSSQYSIPHIFNISIQNSVPEKDLMKLSDRGFYCSSKSACSGQEEFSKSVYALTKNKEYAKTSFRISLSHLTSFEEIDAFVNTIKEIF